MIIEEEPLTSLEISAAQLQSDIHFSTFLLNHISTLFSITCANISSLVTGKVCTSGKILCCGVCSHAYHYLLRIPLSSPCRIHCVGSTVTIVYADFPKKYVDLSTKTDKHENNPHFSPQSGGK